MTIEEIKQNFPLTWRDISNFRDKDEYPIDIRSDIYNARHYFDSVNMICCVYPEDTGEDEKTFGAYINFQTITKHGEYIRYNKSRSGAENAVIIRCFQIREKQLESE